MMRLTKAAHPMLNEVSLISLLPHGDHSSFTRFLYPLRARAAVFVSLLFIVYYLGDISVSVSLWEERIDAVYAVRRFIGLAASLLLFVCSMYGNASLVSKGSHLWYTLVGLSRVTLLAGYVFFRSKPPFMIFIMTLFTSFISTTAFAAAMHIQFVIVVILFTTETLFALLVMQRGFGDYNDADGVALMSTTVVLYFVALWAIHTAQYNTAMMYIFDRHYQEEKMEKQLQQKVQELQRIHLANTLHEIGSPLQAFVNGLDDIKENCSSISARSGFDLQETLSSMEASVSLISLARRRAIAYAKPSTEEGNALQPVLSEVDVRQLLQECWKVVQALNRNRQVPVTLDATVHDNVPPLICCDSDWLLEAMTTYVSNAIRFTDEGHVRVTVSMIEQRNRSSLRRRSSERTQYIHLEVADSSDVLSSIPPESLNDIFRPFNQTQPLNDELNSVALGLLGVRTKMELLEGTVGVRPNHPKGAVFWLEFPYRPPESCAEREPPSMEMTADCFAEAKDVQLELASGKDDSPTQLMSSPHPHSPQHLMRIHHIDPTKMHLLVVEDEKFLLKFIKKKLTNYGFNVDEAYDGEQALRCMQSKNYDVVIMDQNMPRISGLEAVRAFREWQAMNFPEITTCRSSNASDVPGFDPVIFMMSASILEADRVEARDLQIAHYFDKPLQVNRVVSKILAHVASKSHRLRRLQRESFSVDEQASAT